MGVSRGASTFFALVLTVFEKRLAIERYQMLLLTERVEGIQSAVLD